MYTKLEDMPELKEGQVECFEIDGKSVYITFKTQDKSTCENCIFRNMLIGFCKNAKCMPGERSDNKCGVYVKTFDRNNDIDITESNWDFVDKNLSTSGEPYNERQSNLRVKMDEGKVLGDGELLEYYRNLAMVYIDAVNNFTKHIIE